MARADRSAAAIAPTADDLARARAADSPGAGAHQQAEAVCAGAEGITVLCSATPAGGAEHTRLLRLSDGGDVRWERRFAPEHGAGRALAALPSGGFAVAGDVACGAMAYEARLLLVDAGGGFVAARSDGPPGVTGHSAVAVLADGSLLAGGMSDGLGRVLCFDDALVPHRDMEFPDADIVRGLAALADGGFAVAASGGASTTAFESTLLAVFGAESQPRWRLRLPSSGRAEPAALTVLADESLVVVGHRTEGAHDAARCWVLRTDASGDPRCETLLGAAGEERRGRGVAALADGGVAVASDGLRDGRRGLRLARLAAGGSLVWERSFGGGERAEDTSRGLAVTPDGGLVLVGSTRSKGPDATNAWILRVDAAGRVLWERVFGCAPGD